MNLPVAALIDQAGPSPLGRGQRVLVVDDLAVCREGLATKLALFSFEATVAGSVDEALTRLGGEERFDLVLADELMPGKGGMELLAAMRAQPRHERLPFVLLSLFGSDHAAVAGVPHLPDAIGLKPIRAIKLAMLLDKVLSGEAPRLTNAPPATRANAAFQGRRVLLSRTIP